MISANPMKKESDNLNKPTISMDALFDKVDSVEAIEQRKEEKLKRSGSYGGWFLSRSSITVGIFVVVGLLLMFR